jgi:hypothetical protein
MAKKFLTGLRLVNLTSDPASGLEGELYFNTTSDEIKVYADGNWESIGGGGIGYYFSTASPTVSANTGDIFYRLNSASTQIQEIYAYYQNSWIRYEDDIFLTWNDFFKNKYRYYIANNFTWYLGNESLV